MNYDSDISDFNESSEDEDMEISNDLEIESDSDQSASCTTGAPGPSQLCALRRSYVWQTANNPPQLTTFVGQEE